MDERETLYIDGKVYKEFQVGDRFTTREQLEYLQNKREYEQKQEQSKTSDKFVWLVFKYGETLLENMSGATLTRLLFIATYCDDNGYVGSKQDVMYLTHLPQRTFYNFIDEANTLGALRIDGQELYINHAIARYGDCPKDANFTRIFKDGIRNAYNSCALTEHKTLSYILRIIPFLGRQTNAIVAQGYQEKQFTNQLQRLRFGEFCDIIGYNRKNSKSLARHLLTLKVYRENLIGFMAFSTNPEQWFIVVNPRICYGGEANSERWNALKVLFANEQDIKDVKKVL